jgi:hypothetical protein
MPEIDGYGFGRAYGQLRTDPGALEALRARGVEVGVLPPRPSSATPSWIRARRRRRYI